jgi:hypothetical protein
LKGVSSILISSSWFLGVNINCLFDDSKASFIR